MSEAINYNEPVDLKITCLKCPGTAVKFERTVPAYLVSGLIIAFHGSHEGHQLEIVADGQTYRPGER